MQTTSKILMVRPFRFAFNEETAQNNFFQQEGKSDSVAVKALEEFDAFVNQLRGKDVDVTVVQDTPEPWTPDSVFPNNWFSSHISGELVLYPMFAENRRQERKREALGLLTRKMNHRKVIDLTHWEKEDEFLEGTGSMVFDRDKQTAYCCRSPRTSEKVLADFCARMNYDAVVFDATDKNGNLIYHTNVMMAVGNQVAIVCLESIKDDNERQKVVSRLTSAGKIIVDISLDQVARFAGNMLEVKSRNGHPIMVMSASARNALTAPQETIISTYNTILSVPLSTIETNGGGSARCMIAEIFY
ncbi:amidinotransferase [Proteiniphilum saccharofermentans]|uniref:Amidinotransferase n=1 Tax=Proteiniphilum saccharofermentans TaxID=1642647 RepID=A0A1R3T618_9BACT|nr:arginine deiminase-related protein [Proteiniphilum saccharofermentans]SCD19014.1 amidinotransferase [Proteiniphilum saccharofermentans]